MDNLEQKNESPATDPNEVSGVRQRPHSDDHGKKPVMKRKRVLPWVRSRLQPSLVRPFVVSLVLLCALSAS